MRKNALAAAALAAGLALAGPAQAGVVVKSSGPSAGEFPVGKKLDDSATITLRAGDSVTVLTSNGTRVITGAGPHKVGARGASKRSTFAVLTRQRSGARVRTGAVRGGVGAIAATNPSLWNVDVTKAGRVCIANTSLVNFWRPDTAGEATYMFGTDQSGFHVHVTFDEGVSQASLSGDELPLGNVKSYSLTGPDGTANTIEFVSLDGVPEDPESMAATLAENGCNTQLDLLADKLMMDS